MGVDIVDVEEGFDVSKLNVVNYDSTNSQMLKFPSASIPRFAIRLL
jgi:hypothetical protein